MTDQDRLALADANRKDAEEFCKGAFGAFVSDVSQYTEIVAKLLDRATDRALAQSGGEPVAWRPLPYNTPKELFDAFRQGVKFVLHYHGRTFDVTRMEPREHVVYVQPPSLPVKVRPDGSSAEGSGLGIWLAAPIAGEPGAWREALKPIIGYLEDAAGRCTKMLDRLDWKPSRSHIEGARNSMISAANTLTQAALASAPQPAVAERQDRVVNPMQREASPKWDRRWPHDQPAGWNLDAAKFLGVVQSAGGFMWLGLGRAKYLELRVDTRDGAFNLYDRDGKPLNPDDVVEAVEKAKRDYGAAIASPAPQPDVREALVNAFLPKCQAFGKGDMPLHVAGEFADTAIAALTPPQPAAVDREEIVVEAYNRLRDALAWFDSHEVEKKLGHLPQWVALARALSLMPARETGNADNVRE